MVLQWFAIYCFDLNQTKPNLTIHNLSLSLGISHQTLHIFKDKYYCICLRSKDFFKVGAKCIQTRS